MRKVAVATSGGRDSTALLHATCRAASGQGLCVLALHVNHGLQAAADAWVQRVRQQARRWGAVFDHRRLAGEPGPGESMEAWARRGRYAALAEMARAADCDLVLLAHHRRDQAETFLLQALRGSGAAGLAAMPGRAVRDGITWARPWLNQPRTSIESYLRRHRIGHVEDPSNAQARWARNRLRIRVWPALLGSFPDAETCLARAAGQAQASAALALECWAADRQAVVLGGDLSLLPWAALGPERRRNALRCWLRDSLGRGAPETLVHRLDREALQADSGRWELPGHQVQRYRDRLRLYPVATPGRAGPEVHLNLAGPGAYTVPGWAGHWQVRATDGPGLAAASLQHVVSRARAGGEQFSLEPMATARSLKKQFQARGIAPAERTGPLLFSADGELLVVPGLGSNGAHWAGKGQARLAVQWLQGPVPREQGSGPVKILG
jgi:tRNA(Ile)-lysidine synthase